MTITKAITLLGKWGRKVAPTAIAIASGLGVVATGVSAAKAGMRYKETGKKTEFVKPVIIGAVTMAGIFTSDRIHVRRQAAIAGAAHVIQDNYDRWRNALPDGLDGDQYVRDEVNDQKAEDIWKKCQKNGIKPVDTHTGNKLWFEPISMQWFIASDEHVIEAEYHTNRNFQLKGDIPFNEFLSFLELDDKDLSFEQLGWDIYLGETYYGYQWIDFVHKDKMLSDGTEYTEIFYPFEPHLGEK